MAAKTYADQPIKGYVYYHNDESKPLSGVIVGLYQDEQLISTTSTNSQGKYIFTDIPNGEYTVKGISSDISLENSVDIIDAELIEQMVVLNAPVSNPIEFLAADIIRDGDIEVEDYEACMDIVLLEQDPTWVFMDIQVEHYGTKKNVPTMGGSSSGDVNGTFVPTGRNDRLVETSYFAKNFTRNFSIEVNVQQMQTIDGMRMVIDYPSEVDITGISSQLGEFDRMKTEDGRIVLVWLGESSVELNPTNPVVIINGKTNRSYNGGDINFNISDLTDFSLNGEIITPRLSIPYLTISNSDYLSTSYPNPASVTTKIFFTLPCNSKTQLSIYNLTGQLIKTIINTEMAAGQHSAEIAVSDLKEGVYLYNLTTTGEIKINQSKRLVVVH